MPLQNLNLKIIKQPDKRIIDAVFEAAKVAEFGIVEIKCLPIIGGNVITATPESINHDSDFNEILTLSSELFKYFIFSFDHGFNIRIDRIADSTQDQLAMNFATLNEINRKKANAFFSLLRDKIKVIDSSKIIQSELNEQLKRHYEIREAELSKLESVSESLIDRTERFIKQKQEDYIRDKSNLEKEFSEKQEILNNEYNEKLKSLEKEREKLDSKLKEIDDRESKHVRRKIREDLKAELKSRSQQFALTEGTIKLRNPINYFSYILLTLFGSGFIMFSYLSVAEVLSVNTNTSHLITLGIKQLALGLAFGSTAVFFIRWNNKWFERHSNEEFRLKRHEIDLDRASWLVEMALEWKTEKGTDIPSELINKLGQNLFDEDKVDDQPLHPSDQLASAILGAASGVSVKIPGGTEVNLDRKGLNKLKN